MGTVLYSLRAQLPQTVHALSLDLQQSWLGAAHAWTELARLATLTKLTITFDRQVGGHIVLEITSSPAAWWDQVWVGCTQRA
jgi:hypothetical protein